MRIKASKKLGQNFLVSGRKLHRIGEALKIGEGDILIEVGPGHGELTRELRKMAPTARIIAVEKDERLVPLLREKFAGDKNTEIIEGDILDVLPRLLSGSGKAVHKITGNIPYYITGHLLRVLSGLESQPAAAVFTVQKEVAERLCAAPPKMNLLAAITQFWAEPEIITQISRKFFRPEPKVDSAVIRLVPRKEISREEAGRFFKFARILFKQPRKTVANNLAALPEGRGLREVVIKKNAKPGDRVSCAAS